MDGFRERKNSKTPGSFSISKGYSEEPWHSTPVKKNLFAANETPDVSSAKLRDEHRARPAALSLHDLSRPTQDSLTAVNGSKVSTVQRQRLELQLLIAELKDRDQELNTMAAAHHKQMLCWEQDRQRVLILEQRCARLEDELQKRNEVIRALSKRLRVMEAREKDAIRELNGTQQHLHELSQRHANHSRHEQDLEERNQSLNSTVTMLSSQVGRLQVREEELSSMLKLKDKDVIEATDHILELSGRLCDLEKSLEELRTRESETLRETEEHKHRFRESRYESTRMKAELQEKTMENNSQREELIRLKQENQLLKKEIAVVELQMMNEHKSLRDELLQLSRSKQTRAESELLCLRQVCENQQNDLQLLKLNLESAREALRHHEGQRSRERADSGVGASRVLEYSDHQGADLEAGLTSAAGHGASVSPQTQTDCAQSAVGGNCASAGQCDAGQRETEAEESESGCVESTPPAADPGRPDAPADLDLMAVIDYDAETGTPVCVVDVDFSPRFSCAADLGLLHLHSPSSSHGSRRSSVCLPDSTLSIEVCGNQEGCSSSTSRLQRLLAESQEMVASLENSAKRSFSPTKTQSPSGSNHDDGSRSHISARDRQSGESDSPPDSRT